MVPWGGSCRACAGLKPHAVELWFSGMQQCCRAAGALAGRATSHWQVSGAAADTGTCTQLPAEQQLGSTPGSSSSCQRVHIVALDAAEPLTCAPSCLKAALIVKPANRATHVELIHATIALPAMLAALPDLSLQAAAGRWITDLEAQGSPGRPCHSRCSYAATHCDGCMGSLAPDEHSSGSGLLLTD